MRGRHSPELRLGTSLLVEDSVVVLWVEVDGEGVGCSSESLDESV